MSRGLAHNIINRLGKAKHEAYMVGGCVRDLLLKQEPKDWDVCTSATPEEILSIWPDAELVGAKFGVCLVRRDIGHGPEQVEVATFRADGVYEDGRRPSSVQFVRSVKEDVKRRDFTINGLLMTSEDKVIDMVNGGKDLKLRLIRAIGDPQERIGEDHLRMLRAVRFSARLNFDIESATSDAILMNAGLLLSIAKERIAGELNAMLMHCNAHIALRRLMHLNLLPVILPESRLLPFCEQPADYHPEGNVWCHTLGVVSQAWSRSYCYDRNTANLPLILACLLHDIGKPRAMTVTDRIRFNGHEEFSVELAAAFMNEYRYSNAVQDEVLWLIGNHMRIQRLREMKRSKQMRLFQNAWFPNLLELHWADCMGADRNIESYEFAERLYKSTPAAEVRPPRALTGFEVMQILGIQAGPVVGAILRTLEEDQLENKVTTKRQAKEAIVGYYQTIVAMTRQLEASKYYVPPSGPTEPQP